jgi:sugar lactone lactonase YvrE
MSRLTISAIAKCAALAVMLMTVAACQQAPVTPTATPSTSASGRLAACPAAAAPPGQQVLLQRLPAPDDLAFDATGRLLFSDINTGTISALNADGSVAAIAGGMSAPEGIVVQANGRILVGEQGANRVVAIDPQTHAVTQWRAFPNQTGRAGIDGIGPVLPSGEVIVPDSPNGVVWRVSADGTTATQIASGMVRPVGAAVDSAGRIFVADEGGALWVLDPTRRRFATLATPDDVLVDKAGNIFVNTLGDNAIHELNGQGHQVSVLTGIQQPQGIALDGADNLYYTEFNGGRIDRVVRSFTLDPTKVTRTAAGTYVICPVVRRAAGFSRPLALSTGSSPGTSILQVVQPGTTTSGALEIQTPARSITITVSTNDGGASLTLSQTLPLSG